MKKLCLILFLCAFSSILRAQDLNQLNAMLHELRLSMLPEYRTLESPKFLSQYEGTPFLENEWKDGIITLKSGESYVVPAKYCIYTGEIWLKVNADSVISLNLSNHLLLVQLNQRKFVYGVYEYGEKQKSGLMELLCAGKNKLLKLHTCTIEYGREGDGYQPKRKNKFIKKGMLYYQKGEEEAKVLPRSKKDFFLIFGEKRPEVEKYFKSNKLKMKEDNIVKVFNYYDSLQ